MNVGNCCAAPQAPRKTIGNRLEHAGARFINMKKTQMKDVLATTAGIGATVLAATAVKNSSILQKGIKGLGTAIKNSNFGKEIAAGAKELMPYAKKGINWIKSLPAPAKAVLVAGLIATSIVSRLIENKGIRNAGKIEQKYDDRAALTNQLA